MNPSGSNLQDHHTAMTEFASSSSPQPSSNMPHFDSSFQPPISMPLMPHYYYPHSDYPNFMNTTFSQPSPSPAPLPPIPCYYYYGSQSQSQSQIVVPQTQVIDLELKNEIVKQIEYYFSNENLIKDSYLRSKMNHKGWVHIDVIAEFRRVKRLTSNIHYILDVLYSSSSILSVRGYTIRLRRGWGKWILPPNFQIPTNNVAQLSQT